MPIHDPLFRSCLGAAVFMLAGCATAPTRDQWPVPPGSLAKPFAPLAANTPASEYMAAIDAGLVSLLTDVSAKSLDRAGHDWSSGDALTAGGLMAVVGGIADKTGLVNTGAALGLVSGVGRARYQYETQRAAYAKAEEAFSCIHTQVRLVNDVVRAIAMIKGDDKEKQAATKAPVLVIDAVNKARRRMMNELSAIRAEAPTRQDLESIARKYADAASSPASAASGAGAGLMKALPSQGRNTLRSALNSQSDDVPTWVIEDARNAAKALPAELERCVI